MRQAAPSRSRQATAAEQLAIQRGEAEHGGVTLVAEQQEGLLQALEQVAVAIAGEAALGELAQAGDAVPVGVDPLAGGVLVVRHEQEPALLGDHEKQEPVHQAQQLAVVLGLVDAARAERLAAASRCRDARGSRCRA